ncbi:MAG: acetyl-CoA carboxylase, carboxyltransferase subunit beta [Simkaniaceae bacterium]|nr:acetyl-CoA carboxylase, carboxyltransferase subunit beta [Candidatus Sacchlamyda saccharinae]
MGLFSSKPKIKVQTTKKDGFSGWLKCSHCAELIHSNELGQNLHCCPKCSYHYRLSAPQRVALLADEGSFEELFNEYSPADPLEFVDTDSYKNRIKKAQEKTKRKDAAMVGICKMDGKRVALGILDFSFMGGSMGSVVGEKFCLLIEKALKEKIPLILVSASGGARMQESILSLMQMAKTSAALARFGQAGLPYISVLTNPTTGGVTASYATLGDIIVAEPDALIGFAGPRVVEQTTREKLPPGAQKSEFLLEKGMIDCIVNRHDLKDRLSLILSYVTDNARTRGSKKSDLPETLSKIIELAENKPTPVAH